MNKNYRIIGKSRFSFLYIGYDELRKRKQKACRIRNGNRLNHSSDIFVNNNAFAQKQRKSKQKK